MNKLFQELNQNELATQFERFKAQFTGDPREQVQSLLNSGKMTQEQFNRLANMATQLQSFLGSRQ